MQEGINHREYNIKGASYQDSVGKWVPQAMISPINRSEEEKPVTWQRKFESKTKADAFATQGAILYIDNNL